ncbi:hypothetical protein HHI36_004346 [Cryptolaemus montrouzieri]|uniref:Uncharacterized protein n=1 Tax=Cryptolaemus montrouzieri TaxID=559131 RepID=A0ABD2NRK2_9CUCU
MDYAMSVTKLNNENYQLLKHQMRLLLKNQTYTEKIFFIRSEINENQIKLQYIESKENAADFLTRPATKSILKNCKEKVGVVKFDGVKETCKRRSTGQL